MAKKLFKEKQQFKNLEIILPLVALMMGVTYKLGAELLQSSETSMSTCTISFGLLIAIGYLLHYLLKMQLKIAVSEKQISFSMPPLQRNKEKIKWQDVAACKIVETPLLAQWHGGNISFNHEKKYTFTGRNGVHITTNDGSQYFLGSTNPSALKDAIQKALLLPKEK